MRKREQRLMLQGSQVVPVLNILGWLVSSSEHKDPVIAAVRHKGMLRVQRDVEGAYSLKTVRSILFQAPDELSPLLSKNDDAIVGIITHVQIVRIDSNTART